MRDLLLLDELGEGQVALDVVHVGDHDPSLYGGVGDPREDVQLAAQELGLLAEGLGGGLAEAGGADGQDGNAGALAPGLAPERHQRAADLGVGVVEEG